MFDIGGGELILILLAVLVLFGPKQLPELSRKFGKFTRTVKNATRDIKNEIDKETRDFK